MRKIKFFQESSNILVPIVASVGGFIVIAVLAVILFIIMRRKRDKSNTSVAMETVDSIKSIVSDIVIKERIGGGNFGDVYRGLWNVNKNTIFLNVLYKIKGNTPVALKKLKDLQAMDEFNREASILSSLNHPNIVHFYGVWKNEGNQYIVCEYMSEGALNHFITKNRKTITVEDLIDMYNKIVFFCLCLYK